MDIELRTGRPQHRDPCREATPGHPPAALVHVPRYPPGARSTHRHRPTRLHRPAARRRSQLPTGLPSAQHRICPLERRFGLGGLARHWVNIQSRLAEWRLGTRRPSAPPALRLGRGEQDQDVRDRNVLHIRNTHNLLRVHSVSAGAVTRKEIVRDVIRRARWVPDAADHRGTYILGLSAFFYHDSAAALLRDGQIMAATHEGRSGRKQGDASCLKSALEGGMRAAG
jgi:hypothetical protein